MYVSHVYTHKSQTWVARSFHFVKGFQLRIQYTILLRKTKFFKDIKIMRFKLDHVIGTH